MLKKISSLEELFKKSLEEMNILSKENENFKKGAMKVDHAIPSKFQL